MKPVELTETQTEALRRSLEPSLTGQSVVGGLPIMLRRLRNARDLRTDASASITESLSKPCAESQFANIDAIALQTLDDLSTEISQAFHSVPTPADRLNTLRDMSQKDTAYAATMRQSLISLKPLAFMQEHLHQSSEDYRSIAKEVSRMPREPVRAMAKAITSKLYPTSAKVDGLISRVTTVQVERMTADSWPADWTLDLFLNDLFTLGAFFSIIDVDDTRTLKPKAFCNIETLVLLAICSHYAHLTPIGLMGAGVAIGAFDPLQYLDDQGRVLEMALNTPEDTHAPVH